MSEKYNTNINSIEEAIKQLEDLKKDRLSFVTGDNEHDNIFLKDVQAIEIVLGNLEALADMQKTADKELENARRINEEHKKENGELREKVKELEEDIMKKDLEIIGTKEDIEANMKEIIEKYYTANEDCISKQKVKQGLEDIEDYFDRLNGPDEDIEYIRQVKQEILKGESK